MQQMLVGLGAAGNSYWLVDAGTNSNDFPKGLNLDSSGNIYISGYTFIGSANDAFVAKYDNDGALQWARSIGDASTDHDHGWGNAVDSSGNVYVVGFTTEGVSNRAIWLFKYNTSGTLQWQRFLGGTTDDRGYGVDVDSSGNVYIAGWGNNGPLIAKYNSSGTVQWQRTLTGSGNERGYGVAVDSSGNAYFLGRTNSQGQGGNDFLIAKYNTSGTIQWQRILGNADAEFVLTGIALDSSGNPHFIGYTEVVVSGNGQYDILVAKYNTSGTLQWQRTLGGTSTQDFGEEIAIDSSGNVYICARTDAGPGDNSMLIAKYNSSGAIQWQRTWSGSGTENVYNIQVDDSNNIYVLGYTRYTVTGLGGYDIQLLKLPDDGSLTGTYGSYTYAASSLTDAAGTLTSATSTLTDAALSLSTSTPTMSSSTLSLTSSVTTL